MPGDAQRVGKRPYRFKAEKGVCNRRDYVEDDRTSISVVTGSVVGLGVSKRFSIACSHCTHTRLVYSMALHCSASQSRGPERRTERRAVGNPMLGDVTRDGKAHPRVGANDVAQYALQREHHLRQHDQ